MLAIALHLAPLLRYVCRLKQSDLPDLCTNGQMLPLSTPAGLALQRALAQIVSFVNCGCGSPGSEIALREAEDALSYRAVLAIERTAMTQNDRAAAYPAHLKKAEEFICGNLHRPVTRDRLAEVAGVSIRTLSRAFVKRFGQGPVEFLKQRRMDAAYRDLLGAAPDGASVTEIAVRYGFAHLGRFAVEYRKAFLESPSATLMR